MLKQCNKGFTLVELVVVVAIIAIISAILLPSLVDGYQASKSKIIDVYNQDQTVICYLDEEVIYAGTSDDMPDFQSEYQLCDIKVVDAIVYMYFGKK